MKDLQYFPKDYDQARQRFLAKTEELKSRGLKLETRSFRVPSRRDPDLYVDSLYLPPTGKEEVLLILLSGVHGTEAFTGSALQLMFLEELLPEVPRERVGVLCVHALNPFGFKHGRRTTENNVNLNRNFAGSDELFKTKNEAYGKIAALLEPRQKTGGRLSSLMKTLYFVGRCFTKERFTGAELNQALAIGQFEFPRGMEYGGKEREPQISHFIELATEAMAPYRDILFLDLHTGLGDRYQLHVIPVPDPASANPELVKEVFDSAQDQGLYEYTPTDTAGFYNTFGDSNSLLPHFARKDQRILAVTLDFGTLGNGLWAKIDSLSRILAENEGFHCGYTNAAAERETRAHFLELFFPSETRWRENAVAKGREVFKRVMKRIKNRPSQA